MTTNIPEDFTGTITFSKTTQPKQYESERVEITVAISDGDDVGLSLDMIRKTAYTHLGVGDSFVAYGPSVAEDMALEAAAPVEAPAEPKKRKRRTKAEIEADKAAAEAAQPDEAPAETVTKVEKEDVPAVEAAVEQAETKEAVPTIQDVADWAAKAAKASTAADVMKLMSDRFGVARLGLIPEDKRAAAVALLKVVATSDEDEIKL